MKSKLSKSLKARLIIGIILIVGLGVALSSLLTIGRERQAFQFMAERNVELLEGFIETMLVREMELGSTGKVSNILLRAHANPEVSVVRIIDEKGVVLKSSQPDEEGSTAHPSIMDSAEKKQILNVRTVEGERVFSYVKPVANRRQCWSCHGTQPILGFINIELLTSESDKEITASTVTTTVANAAVMICIGLGTWIMVRTMIDRRVAPLVQTMRKVEAGDLSARADVRGEDEIGEFTMRFNAMVSELEAAQADLRSYHAEQMEKAERLASLGQLAAGLAHEIKNPLAGIAGAIHIIADELREDDSRKEIFDEVLVQVDRLERTVKDLLNFARPPKPELRWASVSELLSGTLALLTPQMKEQDIHVVSRFSAHVPDAKVDAKQIQQVFLNLMLNAIQAMPNGGTLEIATQLEARPPHKNLFVRADITDTGYGVEREALGQIFGPFFTTKHKGTGLGLSIAARIVEEHGGFIDVESRPGEGSCFSVFVPAGKEPEGGKNDISQNPRC
jgi:signal transduction histidine kinase